MSIMNRSYHRYNGRDQWLAATELSMPHGFIASPLHRVVQQHVAGMNVTTYRLNWAMNRQASSAPSASRQSGPIKRLTRNVSGS